MNEYLKEHSNADVTVQFAVLSIVHPPVTTDIEAVHELRSRAESIFDSGEYAEFCDIDFTQVQKMNGYSFQFVLV